MLSIEKTPPADPSCSCQFPQLNATSCDEPEVDLPNPPLDLHHHTPLPNFSIRDYVFTARSKDIKKNWPFSLKNLQLCLKHGVKDVLPPFQLLNTVKDQSFKRCTVESSSLEKENTSNFDKEPSSGQDKHVVLDSSDDDPQLNNNKLAESCADIISSCRSGEENDFPSTTTSVSQSEIEYPSKKSEIDSLPRKRHYNSSSTEAYRKTNVAVETTGPSANNKTESTCRLGGKKCRLIVKFGSNSDRNSTEDIASNSTTVSETMASKVCPVCKTFSSTSNTTLNAHIDQCLSVESTPKWTADSKLTRHRIKPRKTRLMVDIYTTAKPCTLEELDRRNGTSWATFTSLPSQENEKTESSNEGKKQKVSTNHPKDIGDVGPVYIDANGTKLRILSKMNDQPTVSNVEEDVGARKSLKGVKGMKYMLKKKKKRLAQKHHKYLKLASQSNKVFSRKIIGSQISGSREESLEEPKISEKHPISKQAKFSHSGTLRPWVCSKRRGSAKRIVSQEGHQPVRCNWHLPQDLLVENSRSVLGDSIAERTPVKNFTDLAENPMSTSGNSERREKSMHKFQFSNTREQSPGSKRIVNLLVEARTGNNVESSSPSVKQNSNQLGRCNSSLYDSFRLGSPNPARDDTSLKKKTIDTHEDLIVDSDISCFPSSKSSQSANAIDTEVTRFSSFRRNIHVNSQTNRADSTPSKIKKCSASKKSQARFMKKREEKVMAGHCEVEQSYEMMHDHADNHFEREEMGEEDSFKSSTVLETRQGRGLLGFSHEDDALALRSAKSASYSYNDDVHMDADSSDRVGDDFLQTVNCSESARTQVHVFGENNDVEPSSKSSDGRRATSLIKLVDLEFYELSNPLKVQSDYGGLLSGTETPAGPTETDFINDQEMFSVGEVGNDMVGQSAEVEMDLDSETGPGNSFPEVDPIPIPGPPGSFLPSPRDMGSEDFQGNSSLTSSRVHSSPDQNDIVDGESSDSPISAASTISNPSAGRSEFNYSDPPSSMGTYAVQERIMSTGTGAEPSLQSAGIVPPSTDAEMERNSFNGDYLKIDRIYIEKGSRSFKNDQPCCCQRKERLNRGVTLNYQESQLLRRRKMASMTIPASGKQMDFNSNLKLVDMDVRPPELAAPGNCANSRSEKVVIPVIKPLASSISFKDSPSVGVRVLARADSESASPSATNPILRLMGKNLMVVNKDDDMSGSTQTQVQNNYQNPQFQAFSRPGPGNVQNGEYHPMHQHHRQVAVNFGQNPHKAAGQCFDNNFRSPSDSRLPIHARLPAGMFQDQRTDCGFTTSMDCHDFNFSNRLKNTRLNASFPDNAEKVMASFDNNSHYPDSSMNAVKEIIVIDDIPEGENIGMRESQVVASGISIPTVAGYNSNRLHHYPCYQPQEHSSLLGSSGSFPATPTKLDNALPVRWGCISEGSGMLQRSPFTAASPLPGHHLRSALHSPGFSK